jgi:hypothetical protein
MKNVKEMKVRKETPGLAVGKKLSWSDGRDGREKEM